MYVKHFHHEPLARETWATTPRAFWRKINFLTLPYLSTATASKAVPKTILVDQGTQCDSPAEPNAEQLKLLEEQLQEEVCLAKKAFFLPDDESDSGNDSAWDSMSETEDN